MNRRKQILFYNMKIVVFTELFFQMQKLQENKRCNLSKLKNREQNKKIRAFQLQYEYQQAANHILNNQPEKPVNFKDIIITIITTIKIPLK